MKKLLPLIKWAGSKRSQAEGIINNFPKKFGTYYEPFLGSGSILGSLSPQKAIVGDICGPLIDIWGKTQIDPQKLINEYSKRWYNLQKKGYKYYYEVRDNFNKTKSPDDLLFLSRTCVNGLIRFNQNGDFNNSLHHSRKGIDPKRFEKIILEWSAIVKNYKFFSKDYRELTKSATSGDFIYLDPPYLNTKGRYFGGIDVRAFFEYLQELNDRQIKFALSFDGLRGEKSYIAEVPKNLYKHHILIHSGDSTFNKVQNNKLESVFESLYMNY